MKNLAKKSMMAVAAALGLGLATTAFAAGGDVWSVMRCDEKGVTVSDLSPVGVKEWIYFRVRLRNYSDPSSGNYIPWEKFCTEKDAAGNPITNATTLATYWATEKPRIGIFAAGMDAPVYAEFYENTSTNKYFSDFVFRYHVEPGDFALPVDIAVEDGSGNPVPSYTGSGSTYYLDPSRTKWTFKPSDGNTVVDQEIVWAGWSPAPGDAEVGTLRTQENTYYSESTFTWGTGTDFIFRTNFRVETVHFGDPQTMTPLTGCSIAQSDDESEAYLIADTTMDTPRTFYVWSDNEAAVKMRVPGRDNSNVSDIDVDPAVAGGDVREVAKVTVVNNSASFRLYGVNKDAGAVNLIISATPHYVRSNSGARLDDANWSTFVSIPVTVTDAKPPTLSVRCGNTDEAAFYATGDRNPWLCTNITIRLNVPATNDMYVALNPSVSVNGNPADWRDYVFFSPSREYTGANPPTTALDSAVISEGERSVDLYVYALRSDAQSAVLSILPSVPYDTDGFVQSIEPFSAYLYTRPTVAGPVGLKAIINKPSDFRAKVKDAYADELAGATTGGYTLQVRLVAGNEYSAVSVGNLFLGNRDSNGYYTLYTDLAEGTLPQITFTGENQKNSEFRVIPPIGGGDPEWLAFEHDVLDYAVDIEPGTGFSEDGSVTEGEAFSIRFASGILPVAEQLYCYLVNTTDGSVQSTMFSNDTGYDVVVCQDNAASTPAPTGYPMNPGETGVTVPLTALTSMRNVQFQAVFTTSPNWDPATAYADAPSGTFTLTVAHVAAKATAMWVYEDDTQTKYLEQVTDGEMKKPVLATKSRSFRLRVTDTDYNKQNGMRVKWTVQQDIGGGSLVDMPLNMDVSADPLIYYFVSSPAAGTVDDAASWFDYRFPLEGTYYVKAEVWNAADDPGTDQDDQADNPGSTFTTKVTVSGTPDMHDVFEANIDSRFTGLVDYGDYYALTEGTSSTTPTLDFSLPDPDTSYMGTPIKVRITVTPADPTEENPGFIELKTSAGDTVTRGADGLTTIYEHTYPTVKSAWKPTVNMQTLDGNVNRESNGEYGTSGWIIRWEVIEGDLLPLMGMEAEDYWKATNVISGEKPIKIINRRPVPSDVVFMTEEDEGAASYTNLLAESRIAWSVSDVLADRTNEWTYAGNTVTGIRVFVTGCSNLDETNFFATAANNYSGNFAPNWINSQLEGKFRFEFYDKDGGYVASRTYIKPANPTKIVTTVANWPSGGNSGIPLSYKYAMAKGVGYGRTFVEDATFQYADTFTLYWDCGTSSSSAKVYAFGYRQGDIDNGKLSLRDNGRNYDEWLSPQGNHTRNAANPGDDNCYSYSSVESVYDSFFYGWITASGDSGNGDYSFSASPEVTDEPPKWTLVTLPTDKNGDKDNNASYADTYIEAVFSREYRPHDQMGDINADGIPDYYMVYPNWANGILAEPDGACGELAPINSFNDDEDYFPSESHDGTSALIPGAVSGWSSSGQPFDAVSEIRGYHTGLNFGMFKFNNAERSTYGWVSDLELSTAEKQALLREIFERRDQLFQDLYENGELVVNSHKNEYTELECITNVLKTLYYKGAAPVSASVPSDEHRLFWVEDAYITANKTAGVDRPVIDDDTGLTNNVPTDAWLRRYTPTGADEEVVITNYIGLVTYENKNTGAVTEVNPCALQSIEDVDTANWLENENVSAALYAAQQAAAKAYIDYTWRNFKPLESGSWGWTCENRTDPTVDDTDGDGMPDGYEYWMWYSAVVGSGVTPLTGSRFNLDDIEDYSNAITATEIKDIYNPNVARNWLHVDTDNDGIYDLEEFLIGTSPVQWDTDRDGLSDLYEVMYNINPLSAGTGENAAANKDGDFMAFWKATAGDPLGAYEYVYVATDGTYWMLDNKYEGYISTNKTSMTVTGTGIQVAPFNGGYILPTEDTANYTKRNVREFTAAAPLAFDPKKTLALSADNDDIVQTTVSLYHHQVHNYFGFDPRTGWYAASNGTLSNTARWTSGGTKVAGTPQNTAPYTAKDEFLLLKYRYIVGLRSLADDKDAAGDISHINWVVGYDSAKVKGREIYSNKPQLYTIILSGTTNPNANYDERTWGDDPVGYAVEQHGADTDGDMVPDGWELYIGVDPNRDWRIAKGQPGYDPLYHDSGNVIAGPMNEDPNSDQWHDGLTLAAEYAGTDSCGAYENCSTVYANYPTQEGSIVYLWKNKLFPTDPRNKDTDGDGITDGDEGAASKSELFTYGRWGQSSALSAKTVTHFFKYGDYDIGSAICVKGGGLNPCTIDTDNDGLPDPWERQYAGLLFVGDHVGTKADGYVVFPADDNIPSAELYDDLTAAAKAFGLTSDEDGVYYNVLMGMDPTSPDAFTRNGYGVRDYDWDGDGLQNWQEYMVQAMRHLRYDDSRTPLLGRDCPGFSEAEGAIVPGQWNGDKSFLRTSYVTPFSPGDDCEALTDAGYPNFAKFVTEHPDYLAILGYFADPPKAWDYARCDAGLKYMLPPSTIKDSVMEIGTEVQVETDEGLVWTFSGSDYTYTGDVQIVSGCIQAPWTDEDGSVYWMVVEPLVEVVTEAQPSTTITSQSKYVGTDPRLWDTDMDGMDDYYELYHGLNPLLGTVGLTDDNSTDIIAKNLYIVSASRNAWIGWDWDNYTIPPCDPIKYPWMVGAAECDADGDGLNNAAEALFANLTSPNSYHTDPTPLWMTDTTVPDGDDFVLTKSVVSTNWHVSATGEPVYMFVSGKRVRVYDSVVTNTVDMATLPMAKSPSYTKLYYQNEITQWENYGAYVASFEENEGYDSDNDWRPDSGEVKNLARKNSDPQDFSDPSRRQSVWFGGKSNPGAAISYVPVMRNSSGADFFKQFTVEAWIKPDAASNGQDQYIVSRASNYGPWDLYSWEDTNAGSNAVIRLNFAIGINAAGKLFAEYQDATENTTRATGDEVVDGKWVHVAATYDGKELKLYRDGIFETRAASTLIPANGVVTQVQNPLSTTLFPIDTYAAVPSVTILGARPTGPGAFGVDYAAAAESWSDVADDFYAGRVAEVRTWDGARSQTEIIADYKVKYSVDDVKTMRLKAYAGWRDHYTRNDTIAEPNGTKTLLSPELIQYYNFSTLPGATDASFVSLEPTGFGTNVLSIVRDPDTEKPVSKDILKVGWWSELLKSPVASTVYTSGHVVPWVENMVTHLPRLSGALDDSVFWSENYAGWTSATFQNLLEFSFPNTLAFYNLQNKVSNEDMHLLNKLARLGGIDAGSEIITNTTTAASLYTAHRYDTRMGFSGITDMIPLGSAFAKRSEDYWDCQGAETAWQQTATDENGNNLPDWWEEYARKQYEAPDNLTCDSVIPRNGVRMTAYEAYLRDIAAGMLPTTEKNEAFIAYEDMDQNGLPDWWQELYGVEGKAAADDDNDGLSNYTEYLLSEFFDLGVTFSPVKAKSISLYDSDYFFKIGQLYAGEIFTDHDFMEDLWEDEQGAPYTTRYGWDANKDYDEDGWSNFAECRHNQFLTRIFAPEISHFMSRETKDMPIPTIALTLRYEGDQPIDGEDGQTLHTDPDTASNNQLVNMHANIVIQTFTKQGLVVPDATYIIKPGELTKKEVFLGAYTDNIVRGNLSPGYVEPNTVSITVMPFESDIYKWQVVYRDDDADDTTTTTNLQAYAYTGSYEDYMSAVYKWGSSKVQLLSATPDWAEVQDVSLKRAADSLEGTLTIGGDVMGTVNLQTGEFALDMSKLEGATTAEGDEVDLTSMVFRIEYYSVVPTLQKNKLTLYLGEPNTGYVKEGKNTIVAFIDNNTSGDNYYTYGEPLGMTQVDIGWHSTEAEIEMTDTSPIITRANLLDGYTDRTAMWGIWDGDWTNLLEGVTSGGKYERVRIIRTLVNGADIRKLGVPDRVIFDKAINLDHRSYFYEGDVLEHGAFDIDWDYFDSDISSRMEGDPIEVTYRVVLGNGTISSTATNNLYSKATVRDFDSWNLRTRPTIVEPGPEYSVEYGSRPTFRWSMKAENPLTPGVMVDNNSYTAFKVQVLDGSNVIWDSGMRRAPGRDLNGVYKFVPDVYAGDLLELGKKYTWHVSMYNAKFRTDAWSANENNTFCMNALTNSIGTIKVCAKYFGPANVLSKGEVRIEAFTTPDFSGDPVARTYVRTKSSVSTADVEHTANAVLVGLNPGKYYVRGYIDMNTDNKEKYGISRKKDKWESWGYVCERDGTTSNIFMPTTIVIDEMKGCGKVFDLYIEDADTNGNCLPDAWEMVQNSGKLDNGSSNINDMLDCDVMINQKITDNLQNKQFSAPAAALAAYVYNVIGNGGVAALMLDADTETHSSYAIAAASALSGSASVTEATGVTVDEFSMTNNVVTLKISGGSTTTTTTGTRRLLGASPTANVSSIYELKGTGTSEVLEGVVEYVTDLANLDWKEVPNAPRVRITIKADGTFETEKFEFTKPEGTEASCFFRLNIKN